MPDLQFFYQPENVDIRFGSIIVFPSLVLSYNHMFNPGLTLKGTELKNNPKALIIDDEKDICYLLKGILKHKNIEAVYAHTLAEGKEFLRHYDPAVIFLDNRLPDGFGIDHIHHFKREYPFSRIIMITAHDNWTDRQKAYSEGVDFFISKPFTRDIIIKTVEKII